jgi:subtilisin family serine protease
MSNTIKCFAAAVFFVIGTCSGADSQNDVAQQAVRWSIYHEGCPVYAASPSASPVTELTPVPELRACFLRVQAHNPAATAAIRGLSDQALLYATREAAAQIYKEFDVPGNFEWVAGHEGQLAVFRDLDSEKHYDEIRRLYFQYQEHNPNAKNLLSAVSDQQIHELLSATRLVVVLDKNVAGDWLPKIASVSVPVQLRVTEDAPLKQVLQEQYGSDGPKLAEEVKRENPQYEFGPLDMVKQDWTLLVPLVQFSGKVQNLQLRDGLSVADATSIVSGPGIHAEPESSGQIEEPVVPAPQGQLQSSTGADASTKGCWYINAVQANLIRRQDLLLVSKTLVAVIDGGIDGNHPDLSPVLWKMPIRLAEAGWPKDSIGYDYFRTAPNPYDEEGNSHGTHVAGLVSGRCFVSTLSVFKSAGLDDHIRLMTLKVGNPKGSFDFSAADNALRGGLAKGAHLFNLSLYGPFDKALHDELALNAHQNDLFIVAAGNKGLNLDTETNFNATFRNLNNVILVAALGHDGKTIMSFSDYGKETVQIGAPGENIRSTIRTKPAPVGGNQSARPYGTLSGSSQATPLVTLTAALILAEQPDLFSNLGAVKDRILWSCDWIDELREYIKNGCRLNMAKAINIASDIIELQSKDLVRGKLDLEHFELVNDSTNATVDNADVRRLWFSNATPVTLILSDGTEVSAHVTTPTLSVTLSPKDKCPTDGQSGGICKLDVGLVHDVVVALR